LYFERLYSKGAEINNGLFVSPDLCFGKMAKGVETKGVAVMDTSVLSKHPW